MGYSRIRMESGSVVVSDVFQDDGQRGVLRHEYPFG